MVGNSRDPQIQKGTHFQAFASLCHAPDMLQNLGHGARRAFEALYHEEGNHQTLMNVYGQAMANIKPKRT